MAVSTKAPTFLGKFKAEIIQLLRNNLDSISMLTRTNLSDHEACGLQRFWFQQIWYTCSHHRIPLRSYLTIASKLNIGLMHDDVLYETPDVEEALRRLPTKLIDERNFRITRALQYSGQKKFLAKEDWTKYEEDVRYLQPYLTEVIKERLEKEAWDRK